MSLWLDGLLMFCKYFIDFLQSTAEVVVDRRNKSKHLNVSSRDVLCNGVICLSECQRTQCVFDDNGALSEEGDMW